MGKLVYKRKYWNVRDRKFVNGNIKPNTGNIVRKRQSGQIELKIMRVVSSW